jgi:thiamine biosynthesis lipoprotein
LASGQAIATSGKTYRYRVIDSKQYSHIINPKSMTPVKHNVTSSVVAENAMKADYLASAFNIIIDENLRNEILAQNDQVGLMLLRNQQVILRTENFPLNESIAEEENCKF